MKVAYDDDAGNHVTIEQKGPGLYRIYGTLPPPDSRWREWTAASRDVPNIEMFLKEFQVLGDLVVGQIVGSNGRS